ncbi:MAG: DUF669 domain-containing protein [Planctomycetota bacterium]
MEVDFSHVSDVESFASVPEGVYVCAIREVREGRTREGDPRWWFRLEVVEGDHAGRTAAWDGLSFSERGMARVKAVLGRLGLQTEGVVELAPEDLVGRSARVELVLEEREDQLSGRRVVRLRVPYLGYQALDDGDGAGDRRTTQDDASSDRTPF